MSYRQGYLALLPLWGLGVALGAALLVRAHRQPARAVALRLGAVGVGATLAVLLALYSEPPPGQLFEDLRAAYLDAAARVFVEPERLYLEYSHGYVNVPIVAVAFAPFVGLPPALAVWGFALLGVAATLAAALVLVRLSGASRERALWIAALFLACGPLYNSLREGNTTHFVLAGLVFAWWALDRGRDFVAGALLGACALVKLPLALLGVPLLARGRGRAVVGALLAGGSLLALSVLFFGLEAHLVWWREVVQPSGRGPIGAFNAQSLDGLWVRALTGARHLRDWTPLETAIPGFALLRGASVALLVGVTGVSLYRAGPPVGPVAMRVEMALALVLALLLSPISWSHYYLWMLIPLALLAGGDTRWPASRGLQSALLVGGLLVSAPVVLVPPPQPALQLVWAHVATSSAALGGLLLWGALLRLRTGEAAAR